MSKDSEAQFETVAAALTRSSSAVRGKMFGMSTLMIKGKAFAGLFKDAMVFKLGGVNHARALALPGARLFDPSGRRAMKEWVEVPPKHAARWEGLAHAALLYAQKVAKANKQAITL